MITGAVASADQARALDDAAGIHGVSIDSLMALASFQCARLVHRLTVDMPRSAPVAVFAGRGNNGGDALGCARHLAAWGHSVRAVVLGDLSDPKSGYGRQARAAAAAGAEVHPADPGTQSALEWAIGGAGLVVDGLLGTGSSGPVRGTVAEAVRRVNASGSPVLAVDLPSGLDATTGAINGGCVRAQVTLMLAIPKAGCLRQPDLVGRMWLADIGVPARAYREVGLLVPDFGAEGLGLFESATQ